jgi:3,2-trans-enoyl-CoA isomerase
MLDVIKHADVTELSLSRPPANALTQELLERLLGAHEAAVAEGARAIIISGSENMFSAGLDVPVLLAKNRAEIEEFWLTFFTLLNNVAKSVIPVGAAITGHAPAGGMVLALYCDFRVASRGDFKLGLNEVSVGLPVSRNVLYALESAIGQRRAAWHASSGELISPQAAYDIGMVDVLADSPAEVVAACLRRAEQLLALPQVAMNRTRLAAKSSLLEMSAEKSSYVRLAVDAWFSDEAQDMMRLMVEKLSK